MTGPKRFTSPSPLAEHETGTFVQFSEYEALVEAFAIYAEEGMDDAKQVFEVLEPHLGTTDAKFVADMVGEAMTEDPNDRRKSK
jgi:hypothetical protein